MKSLKMYSGKTFVGNKNIFDEHLEPFDLEDNIYDKYFKLEVDTDNEIVLDIEKDLHINRRRFKVKEVNGFGNGNVMKFNKGVSVCIFSVRMIGSAAPYINRPKNNGLGISLGELVISEIHNCIEDGLITFVDHRSSLVNISSTTYEIIDNLGNTVVKYTDSSDSVSIVDDDYIDFIGNQVNFTNNIRLSKMEDFTQEIVVNSEMVGGSWQNFPFGLLKMYNTNGYIRINDGIFNLTSPSINAFPDLFNNKHDTYRHIFLRYNSSNGMISIDMIGNSTRYTSQIKVQDDAMIGLFQNTRLKCKFKCMRLYNRYLSDVEMDINHNESKKRYNI